MQFKTCVCFAIVVYFCLPFSLQAQFNNLIIPDFQVNDNAGIIGAEQQFLTAVPSENGVSRLIWLDDRDGYWAAYAQIVDSTGNLVGNNVKLFENEIMFSKWREFSAAGINDGRFAILTKSNNKLIPQTDYLFLQLFDNNSNPMGDIISVEENSVIESPVIAMNDSGYTAVCWVGGDSISLSWRVFVRLVNPDGEFIGNRFHLSENTDAQFAPAITAAPDGNFYITWLGGFNNDYGLIYQRIDQSGNLIGENVLFESDSLGGTTYPEIMVVNDTVWVIWNFGNQVIYCRVLSTDGTALTNTFRINEQLLVSDLFKNKTLSFNENEVLATWISLTPGEGTTSIISQKFTTDATFIGDNITIGDDITNGTRASMPVLLQSDNQTVYSWINSNYRNNDIYQQVVYSDGSPASNIINVNDDTLSYAFHYSPAVGLDDQQNFVVTWQDDRTGELHIYAQRFDNAGQTIGSNFWVDDTNAVYDRYTLAIAVAPGGNFAIGWRGRSANGESNFKIRFFGNDGTPVSDIITINDQSPINISYYRPLSLSANSDGQVVAVWSSRNAGENRTFSQLFSPNGQKIGANSTISEESVFLSDVTWVNNNYAIVWTENINNKVPLFLQLFDSNGTPTGNRQQINPDSLSNNFLPAISSNGEKIVVVWLADTSTNTLTPYTRILNADGTAISNPIKVTSSPLSYASIDNFPDVSMDGDGNFVASWRDDSATGISVFGKRFDATGNAIGNTFYLNNPEKYHDAFYPGIALANSNIYTVWESRREGDRNTNIWMNVKEFDNPVGNNSDLPVNRPQQFRLAQNYPNPFNPSTTIEYELPVSGDVELVIYNILGETVRTLLRENQPAGTYTILWDGKNNNGKFAESGIYFCKMKAGKFSEIRKMVLIK